MRHRPRRARRSTRSQTKPHRSPPVRLRPLMAPRSGPVGRRLRGLAVSLAYHTAITNWAALPGPGGSDLRFHALSGLAQTSLDGLYNLCHVVPQDSHADKHQDPDHGAGQLVSAADDSALCRRSEAMVSVYRRQTRNLLGRTHTTRRRNALSFPAEPSGKAGLTSRSGRLPRNGPEPIGPKMSEFNGA